MATATSFLDEKRAEISARAKELKPLVDEYRRLEAADRALSGVAGNSTPTPAPTRRQRRGRPKGSGNRANQALEVIRSVPQGISAANLAKQMGIKPNYLYRVLPTLAEQGKVVKDGEVWKAT